MENNSMYEGGCPYVEKPAATIPPCSAETTESAPDKSRLDRYERKDRGSTDRIRRLRHISTAECEPCVSMERAVLLTEAYQKYEGTVSAPVLRGLAFKYIRRRTAGLRSGPAGRACLGFRVQPVAVVCVWIGLERDPARLAVRSSVWCVARPGTFASGCLTCNRPTYE